MATMRIKKGDTVQVIAGKDKGKSGKVISVDYNKRRVVVEGVNMITKHEKPSATNQDGGIIHREAPLDLSNVMDEYKGKPVRLGFRIDGEKKVRFDRKSGEAVD